MRTPGTAGAGMNGIPLLLEMLTYKRPAGSRAESQFIRRFIAPTGAEPDAIGNHILRVGHGSRVAWLSHTDTVHRTDGRQRLRVRGGVVTVRHGSQVPDTWRECLGADDTTGVWLMLEMIRAQVPGLYLFHYGEERGCIGSSHIASKTPEILDGIDYAISLDRRGEDSVITHQMGHRTASDLFAWSLADALGPAGARMAPDPTGSFTDSESYAHIVPECTNVSVGYYGQHTANESQDLGFARKLRNALVRFDESCLLLDREPTLPAYYGTDDDLLPAGWERADEDVPECLTCPVCDRDVHWREAWPFAGEEVCGDCFESLTGHNT